MENLNYSTRDICMRQALNFFPLNTESLRVAGAKAMKQNLQKKMELYSLKHYGTRSPHAALC